MNTLTQNGLEMRSSSSGRVERGAAAPAHSSEIAPLADEAVTDLVRLFKLLADETRLRILGYLLREDELHVRALCDLLGQSQPAVSHHLALLRVAGLLDSRRQGKHNFYRLSPHRLQELLDLAFARLPEGERRFRFENYVLSYAPPS